RTSGCASTSASRTTRICYGSRSCCRQIPHCDRSNVRLKPDATGQRALQGLGENFDASGSFLKCVLVMKFCARYFESSTMVVTVNHSLPSVSECRSKYSVTVAFSLTG